ncbi:hypothetical protein HMPREF7545_1010 [Selenomonas noxia ATCC 43541]|nr:hypothetical protein HMPREF7545_1010 [Selenomonas noxia ATCC 43541]
MPITVVLLLCHYSKDPRKIIPPAKICRRRYFSYKKSCADTGAAAQIFQ